MDKPRDAGRGHMKSSGHKLVGFKAIGGRFQFSEKSKKEKVRSLTAVGRALSNCPMGCNISEKVDGLSSQAPSSRTIASKRFKIPGKFFDACNGVDHASVPRKLRSAMKKRDRESIFPDSEKVDHNMNGVETLGKDRIKKSNKQRTSDWSIITKDEEEVVETLYALAGMFPDSGLNNETNLDGMSLPENSILPDIEESPNVALQGTGQTAGPSCTKRLSGEAAKTNYLHKIIDQEHADLPESANIIMASDMGAAAPKMNLQDMPMLAKSVHGNEILRHDSELSMAMGQSLITDVETKPKIASPTTRAVQGKQEHHMIKDHKKDEGPELWPGLSPAATAGNHASFLRSSAAKAPLWLETAICHSKVSIVADKRSWKRSAAHVHISRLIQSLQVPNISQDMLVKQPNQSNQMRAHELSKHGVLTEVNHLSGMINEAISTPGTGHSADVKNSYAVKNDISKATTSEVHSPQKQRFDFLSLSVGGCGLNVNNDYNKIGSRFEPLLKLQIPYFQSPAQQHGVMPFPMLQSQDASNYSDQISVGGAQVPLQLPHYYGSPLRGIHSSATGSTSKQQHQSFTVNCSMTTQYPNWQSGRQESLVINPRAQVIIPSAPGSQEVLGPRITPISQQQQHLTALAPSFRTSRKSGVDFHLPSLGVTEASLKHSPPSLCEESRGRFPGNVTPSRQLLCDERI
ncbi:hypothetical protein L6164_024858 [Bauhinia variegata]|uniref:Uncharacterized protein n=1 Tax=Bauhinia variegata TaxID=167791 RepID=A0ACB9M017_BAUVA|nr:hypothetical protein L6164_024858 [Bauhinia variegata]